MKKLFTLSIAVLFALSSFSQDQHIIDSLETALKNHKAIKLELQIKSNSLYDTTAANILNSLFAELRSSNPDKAMDYVNQCLALSTQIGYKKGIGNSYSGKGTINMIKGDYLTALEFHKKALKIREEIDDKKGIANSYTNIGYIYEDQSNYSKAFVNYIAALKIAEKLIDKPMVSNCYNNIASIYISQSNYHKALEYYFKSLRIAEELGDKKGIAICSGNIASFYGYQKNYTKALEYISKSLEIYKELGDEIGIAGCYSNIGNIYFYQSNYPKTLEYFTKSLKIEEELGDKNGISECLLSLSELNNTLKKYSNAKEQAEQVILISKELGDIDNMRKAYEQLALAEEGLGNYKLAYLNQINFKELTDSIFNIENTKQLNDIKTNYEVEKKETQLNAANKIAQAKKDAQINQQKLLRNGFIAGFILVVIIAIGNFRRLQQNRKAKIIIEKQKEIVEQQKAVVEKQKHLVEEKNKEITDSIEYALRIQTAILPPHKIVRQYLENSFILYKPKDIVAGDFYWMETINDLVLFAACDCTGHGVPGAMVSVVCHNALNRAVREFGLTQPAEILDKTAEIVLENFSKSEEEIQDGMDISICAFNSKTKTLEWAGANNSLLFINGGQLTETKADKQCIGYNDNVKPFTNHQFNLQPDTSIYLFTDGYADQFGGQRERKLTKSKFKELLISIQHLSIQQQATELDEFITNYKNEIEQTDDILVIGVRV